MASAQVDLAVAARSEAGFLEPSNPVLEAVISSDRPFAGAGDYAVGGFLSQEIYLGGQRGVAVRAAQLRLAAGQARNVATVNDVAALALSAFDEALAAQDRLALSTDAAARATKLAEVARKRFAAQDVGHLDVVLAEIQEAQALALVDSATAAVEQARVRLGGAIGAEVSALGPLEGKLPGSVPALPTLDHARERAATRPELVATEREVAAAEADRSLAGRSVIPNLTAAVGITRERTLFGGRDITGPAAGSTIDDSHTVLGVRFSIPIPIVDSGQVRISRASAALQAALAKRDRARLLVNGEVNGAYAAATAASLSAERLVPRGEEIRTALDQLTTAYAARALALPELLATEQRLYGVLGAIVDARLSLAESRTELDRAMGVAAPPETAKP